MAAERPAFDDLHTVAWLAETIFVMRQQCPRAADVAFEFGMFHLTVDAYRYRLHHLIAYDFAHQCFSSALFLHNVLVLGSLRRMLLGQPFLMLDSPEARDISPNRTDAPYILNLSGGQLKAQIEQLFL